MPALLLAAVGGARGQAGVAHAAHHLVAVVLLGQRGQRGLDHAAAQAQDQVQGGLCREVDGLRVTTVLAVSAAIECCCRENTGDSRSPNY